MRTLSAPVLLLLNGVGLTAAFAPTGLHTRPSSLVGRPKAFSPLLTHAASTASPPPAQHRRFLSRLPSFLHRRGGMAKEQPTASKADLKAALTECVGTGILTTVIALLGSSPAGLSGGMQSLGAGAAIFALILAGAKSSGANYNPVVTAALVVLGKMSFGKGLVYVVSQVIGGLAGGALAKSLLGTVGMLADPSFTLSPAAFFVEIFFSFALVLTVLNSAVSKGVQAAGKNEHFAPAIGLVVALGAAMGACMNPAVAWGLFTAAGKDKGSLALWLFPLLAALPAVTVFRLSDPDESETPTKHISYLPKFFATNDAARSFGPYVSEYVGTFLLTGAVTIALATGKIAAPLAAGGMLLSLILSQGHLSGTHINPAVTVGLFMRKGGKAKDRGKAIGYVLAQVLGALMAARLGSAAFGKEVCQGKLLPMPVAGGSEGQAFGAEVLFTALFVQAILTFTGTTTLPSLLAPLAIAAALMTGLMGAGGLSGGGLNPAVATALYLVNSTGKQMHYLWVYWLAPVLAAVVVGLGNNKLAEGEGGVEDAVEGVRKTVQGAVGEAQAAFKTATE